MVMKKEEQKSKQKNHNNGKEMLLNILDLKEIMLILRTGLYPVRKGQH